MVAAAALLLVPTPASADEPAPPSDGDALDPLRERFRAGMEKYRAGAFAEAILIWEKIYVELGTEKGYRLAFNIARAYEQFGDTTRAAEHYEAYVKETASRRDTGETLEPVVEKQEREAKERLAELAATQGRIRIAGDRAVVVKIDGGTEQLVPRTGFVAYVTPERKHVVTFDPGTKDERRVDVAVGLGKVVDLAPPKRAERPVVTSGIRYETREDGPYDKRILYVAAGVTALSIIVPVVFYSKAGSLKDEYDGQTSLEEKIRLKGEYETARSNAYASLAIPAVLGAATIGLTAYWLFGLKQTRVPVTGALVPGGAAISGFTRF